MWFDTLYLQNSNWYYGKQGGNFLSVPSLCSLPWQKGIYRVFEWNRTKLRDWAVWQARGSCYSPAALSSNDSKTQYRSPEKQSENTLLGLFSNQCQFVIVSLQLAAMQQQDQPSRVARRPFTRLLEGVVFTLSGFQGSYSIKNILAYVN